jgi:hypothetical protein
MWHFEFKPSLWLVVILWIATVASAWLHPRHPMTMQKMRCAVDCTSTVYN